MNLRELKNKLLNIPWPEKSEENWAHGVQYCLDHVGNNIDDLIKQAIKVYFDEPDKFWYEDINPLDNCATKTALLISIQPIPRAVTKEEIVKTLRELQIDSLADRIEKHGLALTTANNLSEKL